MRIGILGSGLMGGKLGTIFVRAGHEVVFSYSRDRRKLDDLARDAEGNARAGTPADAVRDADVVLLAVHWTRIDDVLAQVGDLSGQVVVTCSLPMSADDSRLALGLTTSGAETLAPKIPKARVVSAFGTIPSEALLPVFERRGKGKSPDVVFCGDDDEAKEAVARLIADSGFRPVDVGPLLMARYIEPFALLVAQIAYDDSGSPELVYRFERIQP